MNHDIIATGAVKLTADAGPPGDAISAALANIKGPLGEVKKAGDGAGSTLQKVGSMAAAGFAIAGFRDHERIDLRRGTWRMPQVSPALPACPSWWWSKIRSQTLHNQPGPDDTQRPVGFTDGLLRGHFPDCA